MDATREHALAFVNYQVESRSMEFTIASQQELFKQKIREVAEIHPEFLEAMIRYVNAKNVSGGPKVSVMQINSTTT